MATSTPYADLPNHPRGAMRSPHVGPGADEERAEFVAFVQAQQHRLLRSAYLICGDHHLAEDLLQGALVKLGLRWSVVRAGDPLAFVRTVLYRDAVSFWRRHRRERLTPDHPEVARPDPSDESSTRLVFAAALRQLTPRQRAVLVLRYLEDHTEARTAELLGVSVGTVKSQTSVALRKLRELAPELRDLLTVARP
jgi:RNA polymerase sigma-70 factor (sigma-E family)